MRYIELDKAPSNQLLEVMAVNADPLWQKRFEAMGIRAGRHIRKIASQPFGGPVVIDMAAPRYPWAEISPQRSRWSSSPPLDRIAAF